MTFATPGLNKPRTLYGPKVGTTTLDEAPVPKQLVTDGEDLSGYVNFWLWALLVKVSFWLISSNSLHSS